ncbi:MAG: DUF697 domain-containing protein [Synechococcus sp. SB0668_bin_15]|nr:DUF697 domain-containing protein [Synechococcus sp. SB0668_bin_15]MYC50004.1 DUF697 domain-containing protein [Synechococcus sp. SB0662_bin_14]MYG47344.1 DUF697 domain-containing protein [Synechococcus sp. SB0675_bin_6]MYK92228.1 DUF697 domain-containing protein [Synechococcus sp. SB0669_bin_8]
MTVVNADGAVADRVLALLGHWRQRLVLSPREQTRLGPHLRTVDHQLQRLARRRPRLVVFGRVGVGKSSVLNALLRTPCFAVDVAHGCTRQQQQAAWVPPAPIPGLQAVDLVDTPGLDEIQAAARGRLARRLALGADLVLLVLGGDISAPEATALTELRRCGKPVLLVLNRADTWTTAERRQLVAAISGRVRQVLGDEATQTTPLVIAAAPRQPQQLPDGRIRSEATPPQVQPLQEALLHLWQSDGVRLLALNSLQAAGRFQRLLMRCRLQQRRTRAQQLIGRYAAAKAAGLAMNPLMMVDLAGAATADTGLIVQLADLYGVPLPGAGPQRQALLRQLGTNLLWVGGAQLGLQGALGLVKHLLLAAAPFTAGLSLAPAGPVAVAQATLAVHTTRLLGRLTAHKLVTGEALRLSPAATMAQHLIRQQGPRAPWLCWTQTEEFRGQPFARKDAALLP